MARPRQGSGVDWTRLACGRRLALNTTVFRVSYIYGTRRAGEVEVLGRVPEH
jgi:hypothetical protein